MNNDQYRRQMGMDMIREEQRLHDLRPRNAVVAVKPAQQKMPSQSDIERAMRDGIVLG